MTHDLYSVLPELNQIPSMYSQGPSYKTKLNDRSDPYETEFTARTGMKLLRQEKEEALAAC